MYRSYYEPPTPRPSGLRATLKGLPATRAILVITVAGALVELLLWNVGRRPGAAASWWQEYILFTPRLARPWQVLTHLLVQPAGGVFTLLVTVLLLYVFGRDLEGEWGAKRYVAVYVLCGLAGAAAALAWPDRTHAGSLSAALGLAAAFACHWPNRPLQVVVAVKAKWVVLVLVATPALIESAGAAGQGRRPYLPELGGPAAALVTHALLRRRRSRRARRTEAKAMVEAAPVDARVDRILEKVHAKGIGSLSRRERRILEEASAALRRRDRAGPRQ